MTIPSQHGGKRIGAGRPRGTGKLQEPTKAMRVLCHLLPQTHTLIDNQDKHMELSAGDINVTHAMKPIPLFQNRVAAGGPTIAEDAIEEHVDLSSYLVKNANSTFLVRAEGDSMLNVGIFHRDLLVVDSSIRPQSGHIVIAVINGELTVKRLELEDERITLHPENPDYEPIPITLSCAFSISGVVTYVIHSLT